MRDGVTAEGLADLRAVFRPDGIVTAGNASSLNDGAAALVLADGDTVAREGLRPLARILGTAAEGVEPQHFGIGPVGAVRKVAQRTGTDLSDLAVMELNEALRGPVTRLPVGVEGR